MDKDTLQAKMKDLKVRSKAARRAGKKDLALRFRAGAKRLQRRIEGLEPRGKKAKKED